VKRSRQKKEPPATNSVASGFDHQRDLTAAIGSLAIWTNWSLGAVAAGLSTAAIARPATSAFPAPSSADFLGEFLQFVLAELAIFVGIKAHGVFNEHLGVRRTTEAAKSTTAFAAGPSRSRTAFALATSTTAEGSGNLD
jgi:hypothetical protein